MSKLNPPTSRDIDFHCFCLTEYGHYVDLRTGTMTSRTPGPLCTGLETSSSAGATIYYRLDGHVGGSTFTCLHEGYGHCGCNVVSPPPKISSQIPPPLCAPPRKLWTPEDIMEGIHVGVKAGLFHIGHMPFVYFCPSKAVKASVREHVRLEQYLAYVIGLLDFQEFLFRTFVRICVRMTLSNSEHLVRIFSSMAWEKRGGKIAIGGDKAQSTCARMLQLTFCSAVWSLCEPTVRRLVLLCVQVARVC